MPGSNHMKQLDIIALGIMAGALYLICAFSGLWWMIGTKPIIAAFSILFALAIAFERGYKGYWHSGYRMIFLFIFLLPTLLGLIGFAYGFSVISL